MVQPPVLVVELVAAGPPARLRCAGEIDMATAPQLRDALAPLDCDVVLDFRQVEFMDSQGIAVLIGQQQRLLDAGHRLRLDDVGAAIERTLRITGVLDELT